MNILKDRWRRWGNAGAVVTGALAAVVGSLVVARAFGPTEAEVVSWGRLSVVAGLAAIALAFLQRNADRPYLRAATAWALASIASGQVPSIIQWSLFPAAGVSAGLPTSPFVAHWAYALPHAAVLGLALVALHGWALGGDGHAASRDQPDVIPLRSQGRT